MNKERLLNVARALRESKNPEMFDMGKFGHPCGTPACALGHYAARPDIQSEFRLHREGWLSDLEGNPSSFDAEFEHFGIDKSQWGELFGPCGCDYAATAIEAAEYIEAFVAREGR